MVNLQVARIIDAVAYLAFIVQAIYKPIPIGPEKMAQFLRPEFAGMHILGTDKCIESNHALPLSFLRDKIRGPPDLVVQRSQYVFAMLDKGMNTSPLRLVLIP
jgi:hypothetical protein